MIKQFEYSSSYYVGELLNHDQYKESLLNKINNASSDSLIQSTNYYNDTINRVDWNNSQDMEREWVIESKPYLSNYLTQWTNSVNFDEWYINQIWFQQYEHQGTHGWHTHGSNFTGVYYVDLPEGTPKTQLVLNNNVIDVNIKEGDILIFPSFVIHRAPPNKSDKIKTIISFNIDISKPNDNYLKNLDAN